MQRPRVKSRAVDKVFASGIKPFDLGGKDGTAAARAVIGALDQ
jgi:hypothetical protein